MGKARRCRRVLMLAVWVPVLLIAAPGAAAAEQCLKLVFNQYCLGGDINGLIRQRPGFSYQQREGDRLAVVYPDGRGSIYVLSYQGLIYKVLRKYEHETMLRYEELLDLLTAKYGPARDSSRFPGYVRNEAGRIGAIRRGDGMASHNWGVPGEGWSIGLNWTREMGLYIAYTADALAASQDSKEREGL